MAIFTVCLRPFLPDLTVLDLGLPDMDGMVFLEQIRKEFTSPVIVLSARTQEQDNELGVGYRMVDSNE